MQMTQIPSGGCGFIVVFWGLPWQGMNGELPAEDSGEMGRLGRGDGQVWLLE